MNWLGDSKPNFPAQISGILYAQFYATHVEGTRSGFFLRRGALGGGTKPLPTRRSGISFRGRVKLPQQGGESLLPSCASCTACAASAQAPHSRNTCPTDVGDCAFG